MSGAHGAHSEPALGLTGAQLGLWHDHEADPQSTLFNTAEALDLHGPLDVPRFTAAVARLLAEVPALHARFEARPGGARQWPGAAAPQPLTVRDLRGHPDPHAQADQEAQAWLDTPLRPEAGELYRHGLFLLGPAQARWVLVTHHIALDGYGLSLCLQRVAAHYRAGAPLPPAFDPLAPVVAEDEAYQRSPQRAVDRQALMALYAGLPHTPAPLLERGLRRGHRARGTAAPALTRALAEQAQALGTAWPTLLFALSAAFWHAHTGEQATVLAVPVMNRLGRASARVPTMVMNLAPLRLDVTPALSLAALTRQAHAALGALRAHQHYRYEHLWADLNGHRLFGPEVNVIPFQAPLDFGPGLEARLENLASGPVEDLALTFTGWGPALELTLDGHPALYTPAQVQALHGRLLAALARGVAHPHTPVADLWAPEQAPA
ncbi:condensation domain-containing protein [Deinococcus aquaedulcis]|uniref:condensation domain-containing protein n=1 Tax=Deinococcus aquaedulcis TaxID=2840455 RepID=UPI001C830718|nr:condensation domain-containing protein [Deinococcus aquaedulcis]